MEQNLTRQIAETMKLPGVMGVICSDNQGLCLASDGTATADSAGVVTALAQQAAQLIPDQSIAPVVCWESDKGNVLIKSHNNITLAIHKLPTLY